jgi:hypothetical protein
MDYLGHRIEIVEAEPGWVGVWYHHLARRVEIGFFPTAQDALELMIELIQREIAVTAIMEVVAEWGESGVIDPHEQDVAMDSLAQAVLSVLESED